MLAISKAAQFNDFVLFLQLAEVYGAGYQDDVDPQKSDLRSHQTHREAMCDQIGRVIQTYDMALVALDQQRELNHLPQHDDFVRHIQYQRQMFSEL